MPSSDATVAAQPSLVCLRGTGDVARLLGASVEGTSMRESLSELRQPIGHIESEAGFTASALQQAHGLGLPVLVSDEVEPARDVIGLLPPGQARVLRAVPLLRHGATLAVAMERPADGETLKRLDFLSRLRVIPVLASAPVVSSLIARYYDRIEDSTVARELGLDADALGAPASERETERLAQERSVVRLVHDMLREAVQRRASDVHLRPGEHGLDLLYRIDDELIPVRRFLNALAPALVSRIKVLAGMNIAEHRKPQDGRATLRLEDGQKMDMRVSVLPAVFGESVVVRLLDSGESLKDLDAVGFEGRDRELIEDVLTRNHGIFLCTGPTGSGKSTTLYALLLEIRRQRVNILTIEDPVEYHIAEVQQMQVNRAAGFTFASAMRNFLRHDPDVIMVGEIRDRETAGIAVESALTGHLVLSTLHTNTAATTITRLLDLGVESYLLQSALLAVMAQRLVRLTCPKCREVEPPDRRVREALGVGMDEVFHRGAGCSHCNGTGVRGRRAVFEMLEVTPAVRALIRPGADAGAIHQAAVDGGMRSITGHALSLARAGLIPLAEAWRVRAG